MILSLLILISQLPNGNDIVEIASGQNYGAAGVLLLVCIYLAWSKWDSSKSYRKTIADKDSQINKVIEEHKNDIKDGNSDYKIMLDKYNEFVSQLKSIVNGQNGL